MLINRGSCVGVLYWDNHKKEWAVHNGRLAHPIQVNGQHPPHSVWIAHWTIGRQPHAVPHKEIRHLTGVREVRLTHDFSPQDPRYCLNYRGRPNTVLTIYPGTCFGIYFTHSNGRRDVKNGRFLYWEKKHEPPGRHHCVIHRTNIGDIEEVYYAHYDIPKGANRKNFLQPPPLVPAPGRRGIITHEQIIDVYRTTLNPSQQP